MKTQTQLAIEVGRAMGIRAECVRSSDLLLIRAAIEMSHLAGADLGRVDGDILRWIRTLDRTASPELLESLRDHYPPTDGAWLATLNAKDGAAEAEHGPLALVTLVRLLPRNRSEAKLAWNYVDTATQALGMDPGLVSALAGWLAGSADADVISYMESLVQPLREYSTLTKEIVDGAHAQAKLGKDTSGTMHFRNVRDKVASAVEAAAPHLDALHVDRTARQHLLKYLEADHFRLAVLGEFKRGKSTLINALVGIPDLMPTATLPCTSALTEIRAGDTRQYQVNYGGALGTFHPSNEATFLAGAGAAARLTSKRETAKEEADRVAYWRVRVPSSFLEQGSIALIDSPGIGEDYARDYLARTEAERADAAILVFDTTQLASLSELALIQLMKSKAEDLIIAINKADVCPEQQWEELRQHVVRRVSEVTDAIAPERIIFVSALRAQQALMNGAQSDVWLHRLFDLRQMAEQHLVKRSGTIKQNVLNAKVLDFINDAEAAIAGQVSLRRRQLDDLENLDEASRRSQRQFEAARADIDTSTQILSDASDASKRIKDAFFAALPSILDEAEANKAQWTSSHSTVFSPKAHVEEVAQKARNSVLAAVETWMRNTGGPLIAEELAKQTALIEHKLRAFREYLKDATGRDPKSIINRMKEAAIEGGLSIGAGDVSGASAALRAMVGGMVATVIGYIVADIILFYWLEVISGFLNPWLLAAAIAVAAVLYLAKGGDFVNQWIRGEVSKKIREKLVNDSETRGKIGSQLEKATGDLFANVARAFHEQAQDLLNEVRYQQAATEKSLRVHVEQLGTTADALRVDMQTIEQEAAKARAWLGRLRDIMTTERQNTEGAQLALR